MISMFFSQPICFGYCFYFVCHTLKGSIIYDPYVSGLKRESFEVERHVGWNDAREFQIGKGPVLSASTREPKTTLQCQIIVPFFIYFVNRSPIFSSLLSLPSFPLLSSLLFSRQPVSEHPLKESHVTSYYCPFFPVFFPLHSPLSLLSSLVSLSWALHS